MNLECDAKNHFFQNGFLRVYGEMNIQIPTDLKEGLHLLVTAFSRAKLIVMLITKLLKVVIAIVKTLSFRLEGLLGPKLSGAHVLARFRCQNSIHLKV